MIRGVRIVWVAGLAAIAIALAGCGTPADPPPTPTASTTPSADQPCVADPDAVVTASAQSTAELPTDLVNELAEAAQRGLALSLAPGVNVGVATPEGTWTASYGVADTTTGQPMTPDMATRVGSLTKTFTGTLIVQLAEEGLLSLDDPISKYIPDIVNGDTVTLTMLANMHSGVPSYTFEQAFVDAIGSDPHATFTPEQLIAYIADTPAAFPPGTDYQYSNSNFVLLGMVIEQVTGDSIGENLQQRILDPLGMEDTVWPGTSNAMPDPHAHGYTLQFTEGPAPADATEWNPSWGYTAGEMISTLDDLLVWGHALATGEGILQPESARERLETFPGPYRFSYGVGFACFAGWVGHEGELPGYNTTVYYDTESDTVVVVQANSDISSGTCTDSPTLADDPHTETCSTPAARVFMELSKVLGREFVPNDKN